MMCAAAGDNQHPVFRSAYLLKDAAQAAVSKIVGAYHHDTAAILSRITYTPAYGSKSALQNLAVECVQNFQKTQELQKRKE